MLNHAVRADDRIAQVHTVMPHADRNGVHRCRDLFTPSRSHFVGLGLFRVLRARLLRLSETWLRCDACRYLWHVPVRIGFRVIVDAMAPHTACEGDWAGGYRYRVRLSRFVNLRP